MSIQMTIVKTILHCENVKHAEEKSFGSLDKKDYGHEITVSSGDGKYEVNSLNVLRVTGSAQQASVITVTYTPKDVIYIDQYYDNGKLCGQVDRE